MSISAFSIFSTWATGVLNGYKITDGGLPNSIKYTTMSLATSVSMFKILGNINNIPMHTSPGQLLSTACVIAPMAIGATFCMGTQFGKAMRYEDKLPFASGPKSKLQML